MWPVSIGTEEQGWVGGCRVTLARRVNPKTKPFEIPTLHHCQHCPLPAGAWHGPLTPPARPLPTPAVSIWGGGTEGYCAEGDSFVFGHSCPWLGWGLTASPTVGEKREGTEGTEGMGAHGSGCCGGTDTHPIGVPLCSILLRGRSGAGREQLPIIPVVKPWQGARRPTAWWG